MEGVIQVPKHRCLVPYLVLSSYARHLHGTGKYNTRSTADLCSSGAAAGGQV